MLLLRLDGFGSSISTFGRLFSSGCRRTRSSMPISVLGCGLLGKLRLTCTPSFWSTKFWCCRSTPHPPSPSPLLFRTRQPRPDPRCSWCCWSHSSLWTWGYAGRTCSQSSLWTVPTCTGTWDPPKPPSWTYSRTAGWFGATKADN